MTAAGRLVVSLHDVAPPLGREVRYLLSALDALGARPRVLKVIPNLDGFDKGLHLAEDRDFLTRLQRAGIPVCHVSESWIATSTRRLHALPWRLGMLAMFARWALANWGIGRRWHY